MNYSRRKALIPLAVVLTMVLAMAGPALAERGGKGKGGKGGNNTLSASLVVSPDPVAAGGNVYTVTGEGFPAGEMVRLSESRPYCCAAFNVWADSSGRVEFTRISASAGTYTLEALMQKKRRYVTVARVTFEVVER